MVYEVEKDLILLNGYYKYKKDKIKIKEVAEKWMMYIQAVKKIKIIEEHESLGRKYSIDSIEINRRTYLEKEERKKTTKEIRKRAKDELDNRTICEVIY
jgi:hypothetical protein